MMFDHGCDSLGVLFGSFSAGAMFHTGFDIETLYVYLFTINCFYFANLEASRLHGMHLPYFNGPNEGNFMISLFYFIPFFFGRNILIEEAYPGIKYY